MTFDRYFDVVLCIDGTKTMNDVGSDGRSHLDRVKSIAKNIGPFLYAHLRRYRCCLKELRIRLIVFRDYLSDGENAMQDTKWFMFPDEIRAYEACVDSIVADGGGDTSEDGLEALAYAIRSEWTCKAPIRRHIIIVLSDAGTHEIGHCKPSQYYPRGIPKDMGELANWWDSMNDTAKFLVLFTPNEKYWSCISDSWDNVVHYPSLAGSGITERIFDAVFTPILAPDF